MIILIVLCMLTAFGMYAAGVQILARHAIPRSPRYFHAVLVPAIIVSVFALLWFAGEVYWSDSDRTGALRSLQLYLLGQTLIWWTLVLYGVYHQQRIKRESARRQRD